MIIKRQNDRSPETVFVAFANVDGGGSITQNAAVCYLTSGASVTAGKGFFNAVNPITAHLGGFTGIARSSVPINGIGVATAYGYHTSILVSQEVGSITINLGEALIPVTATGGMSSIGGATLSWLNSKFAVTGDNQAGLSLSNPTAAYFNNCTVRAI